MTNIQEIATHANAIKPELIYVAIGCALGHHPPNGSYLSPQQVPPFVEHATGRRLCILIDPTLEDPPRQQPLADATPGVTLTPLRQSFHFDNPEHSAFLHSLIRLTLEANSRTRLIVQDYTGRDILPYYPIDTYGPRLTARVLYDVTYNDGGCFVDLNKIAIFHEANGNFLNPVYLPMWRFKGVRGAASTIQTQLNKRESALFYAHRYYGYLTGTRPPRDWNTPERLTALLKPMFYSYGLGTVELTRAKLCQLLQEATFDFLACASLYATREDVQAAIDDPSDDRYRDLLATAKNSLEV